MSEYISGVCNIGPEEIKKRQLAGIVGLIVSLLFVFLVLFFHLNPLWRLLLFFPAVLAATGYLQARMHFCAGYGLKGIYNVAKPAGNTDTVEQVNFRVKDRQKAMQIFSLSVIIGLVVSVVIYLL